MNRTMVSLLAAASSLAAGSLTAQQHSASAGSEPAAGRGDAAAERIVKVSELIGKKVFTSDGAEIGEIGDLVTENGEIVTALVSAGGLLGIGEDVVSVPYPELTARDDGAAFVLKQTKRQVAATIKARDEPVRGDDAASRTGESPRLPRLDVDEDLAEIDPRLAEGVAASEEAYDEKLDHESFDDDAESESEPAPTSETERTAPPQR